MFLLLRFGEILAAVNYYPTKLLKKPNNQRYITLFFVKV